MWSGELPRLSGFESLSLMGYTLVLSKYDYYYNYFYYHVSVCYPEYNLARSDHGLCKQEYYIYLLLDDLWCTSILWCHLLIKDFLK